ncbi:thiol-disulfide isomerase/thioredoxin [Pedobacter africanus]|uniref:Thiol-disulfide isomerase/thioredoxin n=1 Tax=Pedobacter africanus TaxID=151894 RepID=A0ACC6KUB5_9SPHI|nr:TlpA disulfide reductase family protein [Pedobacter africanus]MDR6782737.1 thiol-disulfide isomerase/thioredoxin [Pedobacter africanus]
MKKIIAAILFALLFIVEGIAQGSTRISGTILNAKGSVLKIEVSIFGFKEKQSHEFSTNTGKFEFKFDIDKPTAIGVHINNKYVVMPGVWNIMLEPNDDIHISVPEMKSAGHFGFGIMNVEFSGRGSEKLNLLKSAVGSILQLSNLAPPLGKQSLTYRYELADRKLNIVDSVFSNYKGKTSQISKDMFKVQLYDNILDNVMLGSLRSENDSVKFLFEKYIVEKKRMNTFFKDDVIYYDGGKIVSDYIILSEFRNPAYVGGDAFKTRNKISLAKMEIKYLKEKPVVRDYLLSSQTYDYIRSKSDDPNVKELYQLYVDNVDPNNPFYSKVKNAYEYVQKNLTAGTPFFKFSLPDPKGKTYQLADFKGKVLVLDFWFNGCSGCKQMVPLIEELEKEYEGKDIQFISVNVDKKDTWLDGIGKYSSKNSLQLYTEEQESNHPFIKHLNFSAYPRLVIVDKNGNMAGTPPDPRSDKAGFKKYIEKYL